MRASPKKSAVETRGRFMKPPKAHGSPRNQKARAHSARRQETSPRSQRDTSLDCETHRGVWFVFSSGPRPKRSRIAPLLFVVDPAPCSLLGPRRRAPWPPGLACAV